MTHIIKENVIQPQLHTRAQAHTRTALNAGQCFKDAFLYIANVVLHMKDIINLISKYS